MQHCIRSSTQTPRLYAQLAALACALVAACVWAGCVGDSCTEIGCDNTLSVAFEGLAAGTPHTLTVTPAGGSATACTVTLDASGALQVGEGACGVNAAGGVDAFVAFAGDPGDIAVSLEAEGAEVGRYSGAPWGETFSPNGPDCAPTCANGAITLNAGPSS